MAIYKVLLEKHYTILTLFSPLDWGYQKGYPSLKCLTYPTMMTLGTVTLTKKDQKIYINHVTCHLNSADISIFSLKIGKFCYTKKYRYRMHLNT